MSADPAPLNLFSFVWVEDMAHGGDLSIAARSAAWSGRSSSAFAAIEDRPPERIRHLTLRGML